MSPEEDVAAGAADQDVGVGVADQDVVADTAGDVPDVADAAGQSDRRPERQVDDDVAGVGGVVQRIRAGEFAPFPLH
jgi:hypothetical protein